MVCYLKLVPSDCPRGIQAWSLPYAVQPRASMSSPLLLVADASVCAASLLEVALGMYLWVLIIYLFFLLVMLPSEVQRLSTDSLVRVFPVVWKLLSFLRLPS